ncbi:MAG: hypothetical protein U0521_16285 [Anaerolineae bacterium]
MGDGKVNDTMTEYPLTADYIPPVSGAVAAGYGCVCSTCCWAWWWSRSPTPPGGRCSRRVRQSR